MPANATSGEGELCQLDLQGAALAHGTRPRGTGKNLDGIKGCFA